MEAAAASTEGCLEQGAACTGRLGHPLHQSPSLAVSTPVLPLDLNSSGRESEVGDAQPFFILNKQSVFKRQASPKRPRSLPFKCDRMFQKSKE